MSTPDSGLVTPSSAPQGGRFAKLLHPNFWIRELPFSLVLI
jgi:hypothetical protein